MKSPDACGETIGPEKIDIVYLWVNLRDDTWNTKRQRAFSQWQESHPGELALYGNVSGRYRDNEELRFSLRSLERFFPQHGHVYIVTDGQVPAWFVGSDRVTIVDHADLIPESSRPVFDSNHIESYLHRIPNLSERFLYFNDDVFLGAPFVTSEWFSENGVVVYQEAAESVDYDVPQSNELALVNAAVLSKHWLTDRYLGYRHIPRVYAHSPRPMLKSSLEAFERLAPDIFAQVRSTRFRSWGKPVVIADLLPRWMAHVGRATEVAVDPIYICSGDDDSEARFAHLEELFGSVMFFCINDTCDDATLDDPRLKRIASTLSRLLPTPSSFERTSAATARPVVDSTVD